MSYPEARQDASRSAGNSVACRSGKILFVIAACVMAVVGCDHATAAPETTAAPKQEESEREVSGTVTVDLGELALRQTRTLENSTLNLRFRAHAVVSRASAERLQKRLQSQQHQAREQMIVAVRTAETWEFDEPDLARLRRRIELRLNRWLDASLIDDIVLSDYHFRMD